MQATRARSAGFTLIELMIVVFIIGLITAAVVITIGSERRDTELDKEAQRLDALLGYVREQAELQTRDYGFLSSDREYKFLVFDVLQNKWRPVDEDDALRERKYPDGMLVSMVVEGRAIVLNQKKKSGLNDLKPQVMIFANGDLTSFEVKLQREGSADFAHIHTDEQSNVKLLLPGEVEQKVPAVRMGQKR
jgi:general secretion pathway protein H